MTLYRWKNVDTAHLLPTLFVGKRPKRFGVGWLYWAWEVRFTEQPQYVELKEQTFMETAEHFQKVTKPVKPPEPYEPDID